MQGVFVDTDIVLDLLGKREPFYKHAAQLFTKADQGIIKLHVSSLSFSNLNYLLLKQFSTIQTRKILFQLKSLVEVISVDDKTVELALSSDFKDFEDGLQYFSALQHNVKILLTRNIKDYKSADIPVMTAEQFLKL